MDQLALVQPNTSVWVFTRWSCTSQHHRTTLGEVRSSLFSMFFSPSVALSEEEKKKKVIRLPVQRSVETGLAIEFKGRFTRQPSRDPDAEEPKPGA